MYEDQRSITQSAKPHSPPPPAHQSHDHFGMNYYLDVIEYRVAILDSEIVCGSMTKASNLSHCHPSRSHLPGLPNTKDQLYKDNSGQGNVF